MQSGHYRRNPTGYDSFVPAPLPPPIEIDGETADLLVQAHSRIAALDAMSRSIPSMDLFVGKYVSKEALMSSQIEGTQATLEDILDPALDVNVNRGAGEVVRYVLAMHRALELRETLPLCNRLLREAHAVLMRGGRGQDKSPGEFRTTQNWIGAAGCRLNAACYVPPNPDDMAEALSDLERYINEGDRRLDVLIRAALVHYQFETIHPFLDGNGRIGRMLITLFLLDNDVISSPVLYVSYFLKKYRSEYYDRLTDVRAKGDYGQWVRFFLRALRECAASGIDTARRLMVLRERDTRTVRGFGGRTGNTARLFRYLEQVPIIDIGHAAGKLGLSYNTVAAAVRRLAEAGILRQRERMASRGRSRVFDYAEYLDILRDGT